MLLSLLLSIAVGHAGIDEEPEEPDAPSRIEGSLPRFQNMSPREQRSRALGGIEVVAGGAFFGALAAEGIRVSLNPFTASNGAWAASGFVAGAGVAGLVIGVAGVSEGQAMTMTGCQALGFYYAVAISTFSPGPVTGRTGGALSLLTGPLIGTVGGSALVLLVPDVDPADVSFVRATTVWGGLIGGLVSTHPNLQQKQEFPLLAGPALGLAIGVSLAPDVHLNRGDVILVNVAMIAGYGMGSEFLAPGFAPNNWRAKPLFGTATAVGAGAVTFALLEIRRRRIDRERGSASLEPAMLTDPEGRRVPGVVLSGTW